MMMTCADMIPDSSTYSMVCIPGVWYANRCSRQVTTGQKLVAMMDPRETYLLRQSTRAKMPMSTAKTMGSTTRKMETPTKTPLPPRKP